MKEKKGGVKKLGEIILRTCNFVGKSWGTINAEKLKKIGEAEIEIEIKKIIEIAKAEATKSEILNRAQLRFQLEQYNKQVNLENTFAKTKDLLEGQEVSHEPVEKDWIARFMGIAQDVSREDLQDLLAKILAGEIKKPNTFSYRTLETLKNLTKEELELFRKFALISDVNGDVFLNKRSIGNGFYKISYTEILKIIEIGLIQSSITTQAQISLEKDKSIFFQFKNYYFIPRAQTTKKENFPILKATDVGKDVFSLIEKKDTDSEYIENYFQELREFFEKSKNLSFEDL